MVMGKGPRAAIQVSPYEAQVDVTKLIEGRYQKVLNAMNKTDVDALLLSWGRGRPATYATGVRYLSADAGRTDHVPTLAIVLRDGTPPYVFTPDPNGVPPHIPPDHIFPPAYMTFPEGLEHLGKILQGVLGPAKTGRIGVDQWSIAFQQMLERYVPKAKIESHDATWRWTKGSKTKEELQCLRIAQKLAEQTLLDVLPYVRPGTTELELVGLFRKKLAEHGVYGTYMDPNLTWQPCNRKQVPRDGFEDFLNREVPSNRPLEEGDAVLLNFAVTYMEYSTDISRTWFCANWSKPTQAQKDVYKRFQEILYVMYDNCRPGRTAWDIHQAALKEYAKGPKWWPNLNLNSRFIAHSVGCGAAADDPFIGTFNAGMQDYERNWVIEADEALAIEPRILREGVIAYFEENLLFVTENGPEIISTLPHGVIGEGITPASAYFAGGGQSHQGGQR